jgi:holo-[acyl-carrier protein] synthase
MKARTRGRRTAPDDPRLRLRSHRHPPHRKSIERFGERFLNRIFTDTERAKSDGAPHRAASYAKRFAAKEACAKALGTGLRRGVFWRDMGVVNLPGGKPSLR